MNSNIFNETNDERIYRQMMGRTSPVFVPTRVKALVNTYIRSGNVQALNIIARHHAPGLIIKRIKNKENEG
ncbi:MAG: hypothetical protein IJY58_01775 [Alphaproteobacteria bacterium]|nr:hypothetical protein [Alphaproteobacteria bacterium]